MIQRAIYIRDGLPRGVTFAGDLADTPRFLEIWEEVTGCPVLCVRPARKGEGSPTLHAAEREKESREDGNSGVGVRSNNGNTVD